MWNSSRKRRSTAALVREASVLRAVANLANAGCPDPERRGALLVALDCARARLGVPMHVALDAWGIPRLDPHALSTDRLAELVALARAHWRAQAHTYSMVPE